MQHAPPAASPNTDFPLAEADRCVLCGLCLPHCPTYRLTQDENESPRGRISLMRAAACAQLPVNEPLAAHLSACLGCRACERVCPSGVRYGRLIEAGRRLVAEARPLSLAARIGLAAVTRPRLLKTGASLLRFYQRSGLRHIARGTGLLRRAGLERHDDMLPALPAARSWQRRYPAQTPGRGRVALFLGCVARELDTDTIATAIRALTLLGYEAWIPGNQVCCGGLAREAGDAEGARRLRARNTAVLQAERIDAVVSLASGCGATLAEYAQEDAAFGVPVRDICDFLADAPLPASVRLEPLARTAAVQDPCSLRNALRAEQSVYRLLSRIPALRLAALPENPLCCGGAGGYVLREPRLAERLRAPKLDSLERLRPDLLVTANLGCALHLAAGLRARGNELPVMHPVTLFAQQLRSSAE